MGISQSHQALWGSQFSTVSRVESIGVGVSNLQTAKKHGDKEMKSPIM